MLYNQPYGKPNEVTWGDQPYINGNPSTGTSGSIPPAASIEYPQREIVNLIRKVNLAAPANSDLYQLMKAIRSGKLVWLTVTGTNTLTAAMDPVLDAYTAGQNLAFMAPNANTGAVTIAINGMAAKSIVRPPNTALAAGDIQAGQIVIVCYDGTNFQYLNASSSTAAIQNLIYTTTMPYFNLDASGGTVSLASGVNTYFTLINHDLGHFYLDAATSHGTLGKFQVGPKDAGVWVISGAFGMDLLGIDTQINVAIGKNGGTPTPYVPFQDTHGASWGFFITEFIRLVSGDYIQVSGFQNSGSNKTAASFQFAGVRISA